MISKIEEGGSYPREDKCKYCGAHIGYILNQMGEMMALGVCDKPECQQKKKGKKKNVGS